MIGANAVANEVAIQMLDKFDLTDWRISGEDTPGGGARVMVVPPKLPPATGYFVVVGVQEDQPLGPQIEKAVENLSELLTGGASAPTGETPDDKLDGFFAGLNMPPEVAKQREQQVKDARKKPEAPPQENHPS